MSDLIGRIGVFDSGLGGLSVLDALRKRLPTESVIYVADSRYAPYGEKSNEFIVQRTRIVAQWLIAQAGAKLLVVACNTATTHAIAVLRAELVIPVVGVEPGIKPAAMASSTGVVGVLATAATLRSPRMTALIAEYGSACRFVCRAGHGLVELIERGELSGPAIDALLERYLCPMVEAGADTVVLGSTHYALLIAPIRRMFGEGLRLVETGDAIARRTAALLPDMSAAAPARRAGELALCSTAPAEALMPITTLSHRLFGARHEARSVSI